MNYYTKSLIPILAIGLTFVIAAGCVTSQPVGMADKKKNDTERVSGGIAAFAGETVGSENTLTSRDAENRPNTYTEQLLQGRIPGVQVIEKPGGGFSVHIRGKSSLLGGNEPLYIVDGMQVANYGQNGLSWLNIHDINKIEVLKNVSDTAIYGVRGSNGVVIVTTKRGQ